MASQVPTLSVAGEDYAARARKATAALLVAAFLTLQIGIPLAQLRQPRPARFGWQMFSGVREQPRVWTIRADGSSQPVDLLRYSGNPRGDLDYEKYLVPHLCRHEPSVLTVRLQVTGERGPEERSCR